MNNVFFHFTRAFPCCRMPLKRRNNSTNNFSRTRSRFCCQATFVTRLVGFQMGARTLQFSKGPVCLCLCSRSTCQNPNLHGNFLNFGNSTQIGLGRPRRRGTERFRFVSFRSLASVTHGHGTQALYWRCAKQKDCAKIFHCVKSANKASSRSAPPTKVAASLYTLDPQEFFGRPRRCGCSAIRGRRV